MGLLLRYLTGAAGPWILAAAAALVLGLGATVLVQRVSVAELKVSQATCNSEKDGLVRDIQTQNDQVERIRKDCKAESAAATVAALRALAPAHTPPPAGAGPQEINQWLVQRLRSHSR